LKRSEAKLKALTFHPDKCIGCKLCHLACSGHNEGQFNPRLARLQVTSCYTRDGLAVSGRTCNLDLACVRACPAGAIAEKKGRLKFNLEACTDCGLCVSVCPNQVIVEKDRGVGVCVQCRTCAGWCPTEALTLVEM